MGRLLLILPLLLALGCNAPAPTPPAVPDPPQVRVQKAIKLAETINNATAHTLAALCPALPAKPILDPDTCAETASHLRLASRTLVKMDAEVMSGDAWPVMRVRLAGIAATVIVSVTVPNPGLQAQLAALQAAVMAILEVY